MPVKVRRVRDCKQGDDKITFTPSTLQRYLRKAKSVEEQLPWRDLKGVSTGNLTAAIEALLGANAISPNPQVAYFCVVTWKDFTPPLTPSTAT
ncbi:MAG: hypothetical protein AUK37_04500 [Rhodobacterales bacterium CG2_30_65_12]|nr:MAG: hypothetical protein AUK37_04500 [Rhodobacterales bacterium CG2_30_65_12]